MEFDKSRVYTAANADELKAGSIVCVADTLAELKNRVRKDVTAQLEHVEEEDDEYRFFDTTGAYWLLAYLVEPPKANRIAYLARPHDGYCYLTSCLEENWERVKSCLGAKSKLFVGTEEEVDRWVEERESWASLIEAWEDGKQIQITPKGKDKWLDLPCEPTWNLRNEYRVKPEEDEGLKWTDLKVGDIIMVKDGSETALVIGIRYDSTDSHVNIGYWQRDSDLENYWEKKED